MLSVQKLKQETIFNKFALTLLARATNQSRHGSGMKPRIIDIMKHEGQTKITAPFVAIKIFKLSNVGFLWK